MKQTRIAALLTAFILASSGYAWAEATATPPAADAPQSMAAAAPATAVPSSILNAEAAAKADAGAATDAPAAPGSNDPETAETPPAPSEAAAAPPSDPLERSHAMPQSEALSLPAKGQPGAEAAGAEAKAAEAPPPPPPSPTLLVDVNLSTQRLTVTENGETRYTWPISSARQGYRTPTGTFKPTWMSRMWYSRQYDYAPMPHAVFFSGGTAIHATYATRQLGSPASHGCVRLAPANAATFYKLVGKHGKDMTRISVHGAPNHRGPAVAGRYKPPRYATAPQRAYRYVPGYGGGYAAYGGGRYVTPRAYYKPRRYVQRSYNYSPY